MHPTITVREDGNGADFVKAVIGDLNNAKVYVGIPEEETSREDEPITNAALMFIHTNGSEVMGIPKRPVIEPSIEADKERLAGTLGKAASAALEGDVEKSKQLFKIAGQQGSNDAKKWFTDPRNGWPRNKSATIRRKLRKLRGQKFKDAISILNDAGESGDVSSIDTPLIDEGELRRSITFVTDLESLKDRKQEKQQGSPSEELPEEAVVEETSELLL